MPVREPGPAEPARPDGRPGAAAARLGARRRRPALGERRRRLRRRETTLKGLAEAAQAEGGRRRRRPRKLQKQAMKDLAGLLRGLRQLMAHRDPQAPPRLHRHRAAAAWSALFAAYVIVQNQRLRIPVLEERPFELKAEFETAQATVPGQGQTLRVAGVKVGDVEKVELEDGVAVVTFGVDRDYLPVYKDATMLLRPQTGLKDMFFEMDPGTRGGGRDRGGRHGHAREHRPARQPRRAPRSRSTTTPRPTCGCCSSAPARASTGAARTSARCSGSLGPITEDLDAINRKVAERKENLRHADHQLQRADQGGRPERAGADRPRLVLERRDRRDRRAGPERPAGDPAAAGHARAVDDHAEQRRGIRRPARPGLQRPAPVRPQPRRAQRLDRGSWR